MPAPLAFRWVLGGSAALKRGLIILITYYYEISVVDPVFQWVQRGELIFLEKSVSAPNNHPFGYYPKHVSILYAWAYFFGFDAVRIFYLIALFEDKIQ